MDEAGWFYVVDRKKDMIIASGYKVWPREVEDVLAEHPPAVREAAVVGIADEYRGETVKAFVSLVAGGVRHPPGRSDRSLQAADGGVQVPTLRGAGGGTAQDRHRQDTATGTAHDLLIAGGQRADFAVRLLSDRAQFPVDRAIGVMEQ